MENERIREFLLNRIYEELKQANVNRHYAEELIDNQILSSKWFNVIIAFFSTTGVISIALKMWINTFLPEVMEWIPFISTSIVAFVSIANQFYPLFFLKAEELTKLIGLHTSYYIYFNRMQDLFCLTDSDKIEIIDAQERFSKLVEENSMKVTDISRIFGKINKSIEKKAVIKSEEYLKTIYHS